MIRFSKRTLYLAGYAAVLVLWLKYGSYGVLNAPYVGF